MNFLQPEILYGLPLLLVPILIHLLNRRRYRMEEWGAMQFLIQATRASTSKAKLRQFLILLMRTLAVLMMILFLARPLAGGWVGKLGGGKPDTIFVIIDRSASMAFQETPTSPSIMERALGKLEDTFALYGEESDLVFVDSVDGSIFPSESFSAVVNDWGGELTDTATSYPLLFARILDWMESNGAGVSEIWIASDLQVSNWNLQDQVWSELLNDFESLPQKVTVKLLSMQSESTGNIALTLEKAIDPAFTALESVDLRLGFTRSGTESQTIPVEVEMKGAVTSSEVTLDGPLTIWQQQLRISGAAEESWIHISIPDDSNRSDNHLYLVIPPSLTPHVEIFSGDERTGRIVAAALSVGIPGDSQISLSSEMNEAPLSETSMIVWQNPLPEGEAAGLLEEFVENGGTILFLPFEDPPTPERVASATARVLFDTRWGAVDQSSDELPLTIANWDQQDGPAARTSEGFSLPLDRTDFFKRRRLVSTGSPMVLFSDNESFLTVTRSGRGRAYWMTSLPSREWSALGQGFAFVPMVQRMLLESTLRFVSPVQLEAGRLSRKDQDAKWEPIMPASANQHPDFHAGIYRNGDRLVAVNIPVDELDMTLYTQDDLRSALAPLDPIVLSGMSDSILSSEATSGSGSELQSELWRIFLIVMVVFLGVESFLTLPARLERGTS